jgi:hypothetical protein
MAGGVAAVNDTKAAARAADRSDDIDRPDLHVPVGSALDWDDSGLLYAWDRKSLYDDGDMQARDLEVMLERDYMARMAENAITLPMRQAGGRIIPAKGDRGEAEDLERRLLTPAEAGGMLTPLDLVYAQMCGAVVYRRSFHEKWITRDKRDGKYTYRDLAYRPATTCEAERDPQTGELLGFRQWKRAWLALGDFNDRWLDPDGSVSVEQQRALIHVHGQHRDPLNGVSDFDVAYWGWKAKQNILYLWFKVYLESVALPRTDVASDDPGGTGLTTAQKIASAKSSGVVVHDKGDVLSALDVSGKGGDQFKAAIDYLDQATETSLLLGWQSFNGRQSTGGSFALVASLRDFFMLARKVDMNEMDRTITGQVFAPLTRWNYGKNAAIPKWQ